MKNRQKAQWRNVNSPFRVWHGRFGSDGLRFSKGGAKEALIKSFSFRWYSLRGYWFLHQ